MSARVCAQLLCPLRGDDLRLLNKSNEIFVAGKVVNRPIGNFVSANSIGKIQAEDSAAQIELMACLVFVRAHASL